ncbi:hypothetical protein [Pseudomonas sp. NW5]|uniref:PA4575 family protein n=1 Tax=Pseudomonas sp. NW5 TaxID=2934934 RepID=UPI0020205573|nr:hypothetical protein [Pseudomonas sp. NW5]MCL7461932.1 hypothetical protein [Pseudomonas sp. NW5]
MSSIHCLRRQFPGITTRVELSVCPLAGARGLHMLFCAVGMDGLQPSIVRAQGPFHGHAAAEAHLQALLASLAEQGYQPLEALPIWALHLQAERRRQNAARGYPCHGCR